MRVTRGWAVAAIVVVALARTVGGGDEDATSDVAAEAASTRSPSEYALASTPAPRAVTVDSTARPTTSNTTLEPQLPLGANPIGQTERARVLRVVDGDTIVIDRGLGDEKVRYIGIDTPET